MSASTAIAWIDVNVEENKAYAKSVGVKTVPRIRVRDTDFSPTDLSLMTIVMKIKENIYE